MGKFLLTFLFRRRKNRSGVYFSDRILAVDFDLCGRPIAAAKIFPFFDLGGTRPTPVCLWNQNLSANEIQGPLHYFK